MDHREARCSAERTKRVEILFPYYSIGCFPYYLLFFKILFFQFAFIKKILSICFIRQVPSILKILNQNFYLFIFFFFHHSAKQRTLVQFHFQLSWVDCHTIAHPACPTDTNQRPNRHHLTLSPKTVTQVIVTHVMYDIITCIHIYIYGCVYIIVYIIPIYTKRFTQDSKWNVHETAVITCDISIVLQQWSSARLAYCLHQILPQDRTLDQRSIRRLLRDIIIIYPRLFLSLIQSLVHSCVLCICAPVNLLKRRREFFPFRNYIRRKSTDPFFLLFFFKNYFLLCSTRINYYSIFVSGGDVLIT